MTERWRAVMVREHGVSLIEMLVAILILGVVLAAFASSMAGSLRAVTSDQRLVGANALATEIVEEIKGLPWEQAALYQAEAESQLGVTKLSGENLVLIAGARPGGGSAVPEPIRTFTRNGVAYTVTVHITWVDDDADGQGPTDATGDRDDYKRITVDLAWQTRGHGRDLRVAALRAAETAERPLRVDAPDEIDLDTSACNVQQVVLNASTLDTAQRVEVAFKDRNGVTASVDLTHSGDARTWSTTLNSGCPPAVADGFPDGPVLFTFTATDRADPTITYEATELVVFYRPVSVTSIEVEVGDRRTTEIKADADGELVCEVTVDVAVAGGTADDTVTATWGPSGPDETDLSFVALTPEGATFTHTYAAGTPFGEAVDQTGESRELTIVADRGYDREQDAVVQAVTVSQAGDQGCPT